MLEEIRNIKPKKKDLKNFGLTIGIIILLIAGFLFYNGNDSYRLLIYFSSAFIFTGLIIPIILKPAYIIWMSFAVIIGWFMTRIILSLLFYLIITPIGLLAKIFAKDFMDLKKQAVNDSYWNKRDSNTEKNQSYEKQY